jgi:hypothetical protein
MPSNYQASVHWTEDKTTIFTGFRAQAVLAGLTFDVGKARCISAGSFPLARFRWEAKAVHVRPDQWRAHAPCAVAENGKTLLPLRPSRGLIVHYDYTAHL